VLACSCTPLDDAPLFGDKEDNSAGNGNGPWDDKRECGNDRIDPGEQCDGDDFAGQDCQDFGFGSSIGLRCGAECLFDTTGCAAACGNGSLEPGEPCDGDALSGADCSSFGFSRADGLQCFVCDFLTTTCIATCGDGVREPTEACDGEDMGDIDCLDFGFDQPGVIRCKDNCQDFDRSDCGTGCGNGEIDSGETCDGKNFNGKDCTDVGYSDPKGALCTHCELSFAGCSSSCGDGNREPGETCDDGNLESLDGCADDCSLEGETCATAIPLSVGFGLSEHDGTTFGGGSHASSSCGLGTAAKDRIYELTPIADGYLTVFLDRDHTDFESVLYMRESCGGSAGSTQCVDSSVAGKGGGEVLSLSVSAGVPLYFYVDGRTGNDVGEYRLSTYLADADDCSDPAYLPIYPGGDIWVSGNTSTASNDLQGSCGGIGRDLVYLVEAMDAGDLEIDLASDSTLFDSVAYARSQCADDTSELVCDNEAGNGGELLLLPGLSAGAELFVVVDGKKNVGGAYWLKLGLD
jgi:cysteine-rich repeat protein